MLARNISSEGGFFLIVLLVYILLFEDPLVRILSRLLPKVIRKNQKIMMIIDLGILVLLARWTTMLVGTILTRYV